MSLIYLEKLQSKAFFQAAIALCNQPVILSVVMKARRDCSKLLLEITEEDCEEEEAAVAGVAVANRLNRQHEI